MEATVTTQNGAKGVAVVTAGVSVGEFEVEFAYDGGKKWNGRGVMKAVEEIVVGLVVTESHVNFLGVGHGGLVFSLADCAFSLASNNAGGRAVAIDTHLVLTAPTRPGDRLEASVRAAWVGPSRAISAR